MAFYLLTPIIHNVSNLPLNLDESVESLKNGEFTALTKVESEIYGDTPDECERTLADTVIDILRNTSDRNALNWNPPRDFGLGDMVKIECADLGTVNYYARIPDGWRRL